MYENPNVFVVDKMPHDWLFERVSIVIAHMGAGTVQTAARAGAVLIGVRFVLPLAILCCCAHLLRPHRSLSGTISRGTVIAQCEQALWSVRVRDVDTLRILFEFSAIGYKKLEHIDVPWLTRMIKKGLRDTTIIANAKKNVLFCFVSTSGCCSHLRVPVSRLMHDEQGALIAARHLARAFEGLRTSELPFRAPEHESKS
jgi:hypothetical protein